MKSLPASPTVKQIDRFLAHASDELVRSSAGMREVLLRGIDEALDKRNAIRPLGHGTGAR